MSSLPIEADAAEEAVSDATIPGDTRMAFPPTARHRAASVLSLAATLAVPVVATAQVPVRTPIPYERPPAQAMPAGPAPTGVVAKANSPTSVYLKWSPPAGATALIIERAPTVDGPWTPIMTMAGVAAWYLDPDVAPLMHLAYRIGARYDGKLTGYSAPVTVHTPDGHPTGLVAKLTAPGTVQLSWNAMQGAKRYEVVSKSADAPGVGVVQGTTHAIQGLRPGTYRYGVLAKFDVAGIGEWETNGNTMPIVDIEVPEPPPPPCNAPACGRYRLLVTGFAVERGTKDHLLAVDGRGDEVYIAVYVHELAKDKPPQQRVVRSVQYGDVNGRPPPKRLKAGSASDQGGLKSGDKVGPSGNLWSYTGTPAGDRLPLLVWEGELRWMENVVIISPSIWEWDEDEREYERWMRANWGQTLKLVEPYRLSQLLGHLSPRQQDVSDGYAFATESVDPFDIDPAGVDRPIGMTVNKYNPSHREFINPPSFILTPYSASARLRGFFNQGESLGAGVFIVHFLDGDPARYGGEYKLYLQLEAVP